MVNVEYEVNKVVMFRIEKARTVEINFALGYTPKTTQSLYICKNIELVCVHFEKSTVWAQVLKLHI